MSFFSNKLLHIIPVAVIFTHSFRMCARLYLPYGTDPLFSFLYFACHFLILAAFYITLCYFYLWTKKEYTYFRQNWPSKKRGKQYPGTNCLLIDSHDYPVTKYAVEPQIIAIGYGIIKTDTIAKSNDIQLAHTQYTKNDNNIINNMSFIQENMGLDTAPLPMLAQTQPYLEPIIKSHDTANESTIDVVESITSSKIRQQGGIKMNIYKSNRRKNKHVESIDTFYNLWDHYIGKFLDENGKTIMRENIIQFATKKERIIKQIPEVTKITFHKYDFLHLAYSVGHHTKESNTGPEIAEFAILCFGNHFTKEDTTKYLSGKLTNIEHNPMNVPHFDKKEPLPKDYYPEPES